LDLGPIVQFVYNDSAIMADKELAAILDTGDEVIVEVSTGWPPRAPPDRRGGRASSSGRYWMPATMPRVKVPPACKWSTPSWPA